MVLLLKSLCWFCRDGNFLQVLVVIWSIDYGMCHKIACHGFYKLYVVFDISTFIFQYKCRSIEDDSIEREKEKCERKYGLVLLQGS